MAEIKTQSLFDHIKNITEKQDPKYWDNLSDGSKKTWNSYMIHRFLSMNPDWIELIAEIQPYTQILDPKSLYLAYIGLLPRGKYYLRYVKGKKENRYEQWLLDLIKTDYLCSLREADDYCEILYGTQKGKEHIKYICQKYGIEPKQITKLKLKLK